jgi:hypothetical protein
LEVIWPQGLGVGDSDKRQEGEKFLRALIVQMSEGEAQCWSK